MNKINIPLVENIITYNYNEFGNEYGDTLVDLKRAYIKQKEVLDKIKEIIKKHKRKDGFLELNEWQTRDILELLEEIE